MMRQAALYVDHDCGELQLPSSKMDRDTAVHYVILAGEIMVEILGWHPDEFERMLKRVKDVEVELGLDAE